MQSLNGLRFYSIITADDDSLDAHHRHEPPSQDLFKVSIKVGCRLWPRHCQQRLDVVHHCLHASPN